MIRAVLYAVTRRNRFGWPVERRNRWTGAYQHKQLTMSSHWLQGPYPT